MNNLFLAYRHYPPELLNVFIVSFSTFTIWEFQNFSPEFFKFSSKAFWNFYLIFITSPTWHFRHNHTGFLNILNVERVEIFDTSMFSFLSFLTRGFQYFHHKLFAIFNPSFATFQPDYFHILNHYFSTKKAYFFIIFD